MRNARRSASSKCLHATRLDARANALHAFANIAGSACAAGVFAILSFNDRRAIDAMAVRRCRQKARVTDSESRILAIKKFSCPPASRLNAARQIRFFERIAPADSQLCFVHIARCIAVYGERSVHARRA
jgi:hypothetical protein